MTIVADPDNIDLEMAVLCVKPWLWNASTVWEACRLCARWIQVIHAEWQWMRCILLQQF
jgi:hypothetical protein